MMTAPQRASVFADVDEDLPDLSTFKPTPKGARPKPDQAAQQQMAERIGFTSREPTAAQTVAAPAQPDPAPLRTQRRYTTGRNRQLNLKVTDNALTRFYALAERQGWVLGEAFEEAVAALEERLAR